MADLYKYGVATHLYKPVIKRGVVDFAVGADWTPAAGDVKISKDGGAAANVTNLPTALTMGNTVLWDFSLTATEMQAAKIRITIADSATKAVEDVSFEIDTYGNASAEHAADLDDSVRLGLTALPNAAAEAAGGLYTRGTGAGQINQPANGMADANVVRNAGTAITATAGIQEVKVASLAANAITATAINADAFTAAKFASDVATELRAVASGTADSGGTTTAMVDAARTETDTDYWKGCLILFTNGGNAGMCRLITGFDPGTDTTTFAPATPNAVTAATTYEILPAGRVYILDGSLTAATTAADFLAEINAEVDTALADYDAPTFAELDARTDAIEADTQDIQSRLPAALVSGRIDSSVGAMAANVVTDAAVATDMDQYAAKVWVIKEGTTADHYAVAFYKNGQRVTSGVTSPTIQVIKGSDGTDLIASTALTEIGSTHRFKKDESTNKLVAGAIYFAVVSATIDGSTRGWDQQIGRDSA